MESANRGEASVGKSRKQLSEGLHSVLVIDDEDFVREGVAQILRDEGWEVFEAEDGVAGLEVFRRVPVELVLTDLLMPRLDGLRLIHAVREIDPEIPVIVLTGFGTTERCVESLRAGASDFLRKPFEPDELRASVRKAATGRYEKIPSGIVMRNCSARLDFSFPAARKLIPEAIAAVRAVIRPFSHDNRRWAVRRALEEAFENAVVHGAGENEALSVSVRVECDQAKLTIAIQDPGPGFSWSEVVGEIDRRVASGEKGKGIYLIRSYADEVTWSENGTQLTITFKYF